jgi:hypothetical protein
MCLMMKKKMPKRRQDALELHFALVDHQTIEDQTVTTS